VRIGIVGNGRMGRAVRALGEERGHDIVAIIDQDENQQGEAIATGSLDEADVAIEFTEPASAVQNAVACLTRGVPVVIGTTGWYDQLDEVRRSVSDTQGSLLWAPNFAAGVVLFTALMRRAGELFATSGFAPYQIESHHAQKLDAPSGTAHALAEAFESGGGVSLPITSVRSGNIPGTHEVHLEAPFEHIRLEHQARDRRVFADGALRAAEWLSGRQGMYTMHDVLGLTDDKGR